MRDRFPWPGFRPGLYLAGFTAALGMILVAPSPIAFVLPLIAFALALYGGLGGLLRWRRLSGAQRECAMWLLVLGAPLLRILLTVSF